VGHAEVVHLYVCVCEWERLTSD